MGICNINIFLINIFYLYGIIFWMNNDRYKVNILGKIKRFSSQYILIARFVFQGASTKNQSMRNGSRDNLQFSFDDLISFNNHSSFPSCLRSIIRKTTLPLFSDKAKCLWVPRLQLSYNMYLSLRSTRIRERITKDMLRFN